MVLTAPSSLHLLVTAFSGLFLNVCAETCMKAVQYDDTEDEVEGDGSRHLIPGHPRHAPPPPPRWKWVNFECSGGCCGLDGSQYCCYSKESFVDSDLVVGVAVGGIVIVVAAIVLVLVCCLCHRRKRKRLARTAVLARLSFSNSSRPSDVSLPPSYEMSVTREQPVEVYGAFPAEILLQPPSYEEAVAVSSLPACQAHATHAQRKGSPGVHGVK